MKKVIGKINVPYIFDPNHKGANYSFDGIHWLNNGEFAEIITKMILGYKPEKDANGSYNTTSDIEEIRASVKSSRFTLVNKKLADTFDETVTCYFATTHSRLWIYTVIIDDTATLYMMDETVFRNFLYTFTTLNERQVIRCRHTSTKMIAWLESRGQ